MLKPSLRPRARLTSAYVVATIIGLLSAPLYAQQPGLSDFKRCTVNTGAIEVDAECATLTRHENPADESSALVDLAVVKFTANTPEPKPDALTMIQGGPGGSSIDFVLNYHQLVELFRKQRDVLIIDQRGTGRSNQLQCKIPQEFQVITDMESVKQSAKDCMEQLSADLRFYTTSQAVDDLEALRKAAGYSQLNVYGVSYGTRVAQHYLRKYPDSTRSVILDGVVPVGLNLAGGETALQSQNAFNTLAERCDQTPDCQRQFGDLKQHLSESLKRLEENPVTVTVPHPLTGEPTEKKLDHYALLIAVRFMPYATETTALLPLLLKQVSDGNYTMLAAQTIRFEESFQDGLSAGMQNSVICAEDAPFVTEENKRLSEGTFFGTLMSDNIAASCEVWPRGAMDDGFNSPFTASAPVLLLSGETDPITPPRNGVNAAKMLGELAQHVEVPAHGHGVISKGCVPKLVADFIDEGGFKDFDASCVERERAAPIFTTMTGPRP